CAIHVVGMTGSHQVLFGLDFVKGESSTIKRCLVHIEDRAIRRENCYADGNSIGDREKVLLLSAGLLRGACTVIRTHLVEPRAADTTGNPLHAAMRHYSVCQSRTARQWCADQQRSVSRPARSG